MFRDLSQEERVQHFLLALNTIVSETGITMVGTQASIFSFRLVDARNVTSQHHLGPTIDAAHYHPTDAAFLSGAQDRARKDPEWARTIWAGGQRRDGNDPHPVGETGVNPIDPQAGVEDIIREANRTVDLDD